MTKVPNNALVLVADGGKALFLRAKAGHDNATTTLQQIDTFAQGDKDLQGPSGSRPEEQSMKETSEASFVNDIVKRLEKMSHGGDAKDIVIVADPQTLGQIRNALHKTIADRVAFTLDKDLTNHSLADIAKALH